MCENVFELYNALDAISILNTHRVIMKIMITSDLHLEKRHLDFYKILNVNAVSNADVLCLLGDIGSPLDPNLDMFLSECSKYAKRVVYVPGNHEYYNNVCMPMSRIDQFLEYTCNRFPNVTYLNNKCMHIDDTYTLIGSPLWSYIPEANASIVAASVNDYNCIRTTQWNRLTPADVTNMFLNNFKFIEDSIASCAIAKRKAIVLTHHAPVKIPATNPKYIDCPVNCAFTTELNVQNLQNVPLWACGHTHHNFNVAVGSVRVLSNQYGSRDIPCKHYRKDLLIEI